MYTYVHQMVFQKHWKSSLNLNIFEKKKRKLAYKWLKYMAKTATAYIFLAL